ncbi:MOSC domain-containing protein [Agrobacterium vitis]|uniref:MOSC domain-containing protein n=1 Tax=Agrobacterium vitis TaxID=373 RepID=UPI0012E8F94B|nr:MOSC domain-containing protein [Agrobacterium vitis]MVA26623.1 MOSC domain-containing protein [Agrobacterium vitis]
MFLSALCIYPVKSARGIALTQADIRPKGLLGDRQFMLVEPSGHFVTQRELPELARLEVRLDGEFVHLQLDNSSNISVSLKSFISRKLVTVWRSLVDSALADPAVNDTLSQWFGRPLELVLFDDQASRLANPDWAGPDAPVTFVDGYQVLITTTASLDALNADMEAHDEGMVTMDRFRPNIVIDGTLPWEEDQWASIAIGGLRFDLVKPCTRCIMTTQDQKSGSRSGPSPLAAMGRLRMSGDRRVPGPLFGWNTVPLAIGTLRLGDTVEVLERRPEGIELKKRR